MSADPKLELKFDPQTINHLGLRLYSTLPLALAELISNAYDADAEAVTIALSEDNHIPSQIMIKDNGCGLSLDDIKNKFLVIGRNRRDDGDNPSPKYKRLPTGKKGLGKLALFGLAKTITFITRKDGKENQFELNWDDLMKAKGSYHPKDLGTDVETPEEDGTTIVLTNLKRKSAFESVALADSLSRAFVFDDNFTLKIKTPAGDPIIVDNHRKYNTIKTEFEWPLDLPLLVPEGSSFHGQLEGKLLTSKTPIPPSSGLRGVTLFSRGKMVNAPEFFSASTSSHFFQYLTGWISADFLDLIPDWRKKRKAKKEEDLEEKTGINTEQWTGTMPVDVKDHIDSIIETLGGEDALEKYTPVVKALHEIVPEYPSLHWRHLHQEVRETSEKYYKAQNYYGAFLEATKKYISEARARLQEPDMKELDLIGKAFSDKNGELDVVGNYLKQDGSEFTKDTKENVRRGQMHLSLGLIAGGRNPLSHEQIEELNKSDLFSERDCLDMLSILSHLFKRLENSVKI